MKPKLHQQVEIDLGRASDASCRSFAAAVAQRLEPAFDAYAEAVGRPFEGQLFRNALTCIWSNIKMAEPNLVELQQLELALRRVGPLESDPWSPEAPLGEGALVVLASAIGTLTRMPASSEASGAAEHATEAIAQYWAFSCAYPLDSDQDWLRIADEAPVRRELLRQARDIGQLRAAEDGRFSYRASLDLLETLRIRAEAEGPSMFDEGGTE